MQGSEALKGGSGEKIPEGFPLQVLPGAAKAAGIPRGAADNRGDSHSTSDY